MRVFIRDNLFVRTTRFAMDIACLFLNSNLKRVNKDSISNENSPRPYKGIKFDLDFESDFGSDDFHFEYDTHRDRDSDAKSRNDKSVKATVTKNSQPYDTSRDEIAKRKKTVTNSVVSPRQKKGTPRNKRTPMWRYSSFNKADQTDTIANETLHENTLAICKLLPRFTYNHVFKALSKNKSYQNYIELTLWDILTLKRPPVQRIQDKNDFSSIANVRTKDDLSVENKDIFTNFNSICSLTNEVSDSVEQKEQIIAGTKKKCIPKNDRTKRKVNEEYSISPQSNKNFNLDLMKLFVELSRRFPDIDRKWLKELTTEHIRDSSHLNDDFTKRLDDLIRIVEAHLNQNYDTELQLIEIVETDEKFKYLSGIFPNADSDYLKSVVTRIRDEKALEEFIRTQMENPSYLTKQEKLKRKNIAQYTTNFSVTNFLQLFPDPVSVFENKARKCTYNPEAFEFLKFQFKQFEKTTITMVYNQHNYNLTYTVLHLQTMVPDKKTEHESSWKKNQSENINLLQEIAYLQHRTQIMEKLDRLKKKDAEELTILKARNEYLVCQCCFAECIPSKCSTCDDGHIACNSCIQQITEVQLGQGCTRIVCFDCESEYRLTTLQKALKPRLFDFVASKKQEAQVIAAGLDGLVTCPFCPFASIPPEDDKVFKCLNPECMKESCKYCKQLNHVPLKCYEKESDRARLMLEEKMTEALVRKCYRCSRPYFKQNGCNKITCPCGAFMCYLCDIPLSRNYDHFNNGGCPLYTDANMDAATVRKVATKVAEHITKGDPNVQLDVNGLLSHVPNVSGAAAIPARVDKVTASANNAHEHNIKL